MASKRIKGTLKYPKHLPQINPCDFLQFVELDEFYSDWQDLELTDDDLFALQVIIMSNPKGCPVVQGTGGLRKLRFAPNKWNAGSSGGARVFYAYLEAHGIVLLVMAYNHKHKKDLTSDERHEIKQYLDSVNNLFSSKHFT